jgi:hypothetical protein
VVAKVSGNVPYIPLCICWRGLRVRLLFRCSHQRQYGPSTLAVPVLTLRMP